MSPSSASAHRTTVRIVHPPVIVTIVSLTHFAGFSLTGTRGLSYRQALSCQSAGEDGLIQATIKGLQCLTRRRVNHLRECHIAALGPDVDRTNGRPLLPVSIRTQSPVLIEAGKYLRECLSTVGLDEAATQLHSQLWRFDIHWTLLPKDSEELKALGRWASSTFKLSRPKFSCVPVRQTLEPTCQNAY